MEEALGNLRTMIETAGMASGVRFEAAPERCVLKAFVRRAGDYRQVRALLERHLGPDVPVLYLEVDLCRSELLFEIEGLFTRPALDQP